MFPDIETESQAWRDSNSAGQMGHVPWNKGLTNCAKAPCGKLRCIANTETGIVSFLSKSIPTNKEYVLFNCKHLAGRTWSDKRRAKVPISPFYDYKSEHPGNFGVIHSEESRKQASESVKAFIGNLPAELQSGRIREWREATSQKPNQSEALLDSILQRNFPGEWKYVGGGDFILGGKIPDFLNINGKKQLIELYGDYWHGRKRANLIQKPISNLETGVVVFPQRKIEDNESFIKTVEKDRIDFFQGFGFSTLVIWEHELQNEVAVVKKVKVLNDNAKREVKIS